MKTLVRPKPFKQSKTILAPPSRRKQVFNRKVKSSDKVCTAQRKYQWRLSKELIPFFK